jgi:hypothetical protein
VQYDWEGGKGLNVYNVDGKDYSFYEKEKIGSSPYTTY